MNMLAMDLAQYSARKKFLVEKKGSALSSPFPRSTLLAYLTFIEHARFRLPVRPKHGPVTLEILDSKKCIRATTPRRMTSSRLECWRSHTQIIWAEIVYGIYAPSPRSSLIGPSLTLGFALNSQSSQSMFVAPIFQNLEFLNNPDQWSQRVASPTEWRR
ncbi:hypothetical protein HYPSUDRAFT_724234 [Hypholoma sublateritium FD-334 SS-4]|uniref:Uncharacterized protein n=1 Tax=Hypholoma sublateritium (strain FD-334 SS-4) TaxID=945553 RepID=A0A0D2MDB9_HYPSF|nr:hypothetical protein HYPSUDRAFT_724234 [Hypholoma sublateritium FD-334 SS-4]